MYQHTLTQLEIACGVTLEQVGHELPRGVFRQDSSVFIVASSAPPALASSVARAAFAGEPVEYVGTTLLGRVYRRAPKPYRVGDKVHAVRAGKGLVYYRAEIVSVNRSSNITDGWLVTVNYLSGNDEPGAEPTGQFSGTTDELWKWVY